MDKVFLLGLTLLCLLQGGETKIGKKGKEILCTTCEEFRNGSCLKGAGTCATKVKKGCRTQSIHKYNVNTKEWSFSYAKLECVNQCGDPTIFLAWTQLVNFCCSDSDRCNEKYSLA